MRPPDCNAQATMSPFGKAKAPPLLGMAASHERARTIVGHALSTDLEPVNRRSNSGELAKLIDATSG